MGEVYRARDTNLDRDVARRQHSLVDGLKRGSVTGIVFGNQYGFEHAISPTVENETFACSL
jgi:hypothetical protein